VPRVEVAGDEIGGGDPGQQKPLDRPVLLVHLTPVARLGSVALSLQKKRYRICKRMWYKVDDGSTKR
jgi:hypothetical protein